MNNIEVKIDYFSATFPLNVDDSDSLLFAVHETVRLLALYLNIKDEEIFLQKYSTNNYNYQYMLGEYIILRLDGPMNAYYQRTCHLELKGDACRDFETRNKDKTWINFLLFMKQLNARFKRIDIAIDDFKGNVIDLPWILNKVDKHLYTSVFRSNSKPIGRLEDGLTLQFGSNDSDVELVIYDKKKERIKRKKSDSHIYWLRYEMRFRNNNAAKIAYMLASMYAKDEVPLYGTKLQKFAFEQLYRIIDFKVDNNYSQHNQRLAETDPKWLEFLHNVEKGELRIPEDDNPIPSTYETFEEFYGQAFTQLGIMLYLKNHENENLFNIEVRKFMLKYWTLTKKRFQKLNIYLGQMECRTVDEKEMERLKKQFEGVIDESLLPF